MKRCRSLTVWPAVADLMTVLAVLGLFSALALIPNATREKNDLLLRNRELQLRIQRQKQEIAELQNSFRILEMRCEEERQECEERLIRNERMFQATQQVQEIIDELSAENLEFGDDQTLEFGDDLVDYELNDTHPLFKDTGREQLRRFCRLLDRKLTAASTPELDLRDLFVIEVQGHTDSTQCPGDPHCNWWVSASRAAHFLALLQQESVCPGGSELKLRAVGLADSAPLSLESDILQVKRRIELQIVPDYELILGLGNEKAFPADL